MSEQSPTQDSPGSSDERLSLLVDAYLHGELSPDGLAELETRLKLDPAAVAQLIAITEQAGMLREVFGGALATDSPALIDVPGDVVQSTSSITALIDPNEGVSELPLGFLGIEPDETTEASRPALRRRSPKRSRLTLHTLPRVLGVFGVAAGVLLSAWLVIHFSTREASPPSPPVVDQPPQTRPVVAVLVESVDARWGGDDADTGPSVFTARRYELHDGLAEIALTDGARVLLEGPVAFELRGPNALGLEYGRLVAEVPPAATGFAVETPDARVVDYGTEFGVDVAADGVTRTHVFAGEVSVASLRAPTGVPANRLYAGEGLAMDGSGRARPFEADPLAFVRDEEFRARLQSKRSPYHRWLAYSYRLRRDPALRLYFGIDHADREAGELRNMAAPRGGQLVGILGDPAHGWSAPTWGEGRWPQKPGLRFDHDRSTGVMVPAGAGLDLGTSYTLACWVRFDAPGIRHLITRIVMGEDGFDAVVNLVAILGEVPTVVLRPDSVFYHTGPSVRSNWLALCTEGILDRYRGWILIAVTADAGRVKTYLNGELIDNRRQDVFEQAALEPLVLGASVAQPGEGMDGWIDEVMILSRAMEAGEIEAMYTAGNPDGGERD